MALALPGRGGDRLETLKREVGDVGRALGAYIFRHRGGWVGGHVSLLLSVGENNIDWSNKLMLDLTCIETQKKHVRVLATHTLQDTVGSEGNAHNRFIEII